MKYLPGLPPTFPVTVLVDSREKRPFSFEGIAADMQDGGLADGSVELVVASEIVCLGEGDYSLKGFHGPTPETGGGVAVERKSKSDLWGTIAQGRERFERELERLSAYKVAAVVCEADWEMMREAPPEHTEMKFKTVYRSIIGWKQKFPTVQWELCPGRRFAEIHCFRILQMYYRKWLKEQKEKAK
ncbi:MAG TPA: ERCC4 domain-containing protein [Bryobacteraceae bacterium]|nr:ERCC4 domain-containing protein [Bryobacteraceae bacterium]